MDSLRRIGVAVASKPVKVMPMGVGEEKPQAPSDRDATQHRRSERLAATLRANLAKRKEQGRARARRGEKAAAAGQLGSENAAVPGGPALTGQPEPSAHDSAEIIPEKSAGQAN